jgi:hypothetical protein
MCPFRMEFGRELVSSAFTYGDNCRITARLQFGKKICDPGKVDC